MLVVTGDWGVITQLINFNLIIHSHVKSPQAIWCFPTVKQNEQLDSYFVTFLHFPHQLFSLSFIVLQITIQLAVVDQFPLVYYQVLFGQNLKILGDMMVIQCNIM